MEERKEFNELIGEHFKMPLRADESCLYVFDSDNQMVLSVADDNDFEKSMELLPRIVKKLNGESDEYMESSILDYDSFVAEGVVFYMRGFGYLISSACEGMEYKDACDYQTDLMFAIMDLLSA